MRLPKDVRDFFPISEIKKSLHTSSYKHACSQARQLVAEAEKVFMMIRSQALTMPLVYKIIDRYLDQLFLGNQAEIKKELFDTYDPDVINNSAIKSADELIVQNRKLLAACKYVDARREEARSILEGHKVSFDETSPEFDELCKELMIADIKQCEIIKSRAVGELHQYDIDLKNRKKSNSIQEAVQSYIESRAQSSKARSLTKLPEKFSKILECFEYEAGNNEVLLSDIDYELTKKVGFRLKKYPAYRNTRYAGKSLDEIYMLNKVSYSSESTLDEELTLLSSLYSFAKEKMYGLDRNYAQGLSKIVVGKTLKKESSARDQFETADINEILNGLLKVKSKFHLNPHRYLIPLISLYSGMRVNEICQLYLDDIQLVEGIWCFNNNEDKPGKSLKNKNSIRINPIHPDLIKIGLISFCESQRQKGYTKLWEGVRNNSCDYYEKQGNCSHYFDKWFNGTFKKYLKLSNPSKQTFHSFRHSFLNWYKQNVDLSQHWLSITALSGHLEEDDMRVFGVNTDSIAFKRYGKDWNVKKQFETLKLLNYGIDIKRLKINT